MSTCRNRPIAETVAVVRGKCAKAWGGLMGHKLSAASGARVPHLLVKGRRKLDNLVVDPGDVHCGGLTERERGIRGEREQEEKAW